MPELGLKYNKDEYKKLRFRVDEIDVLSYDPRVSFPEINYYPELSDKALISGLVMKNMYGQIFAWIVYAYDPTSPYVRLNDGIIKRKTEAMEAVGISKNKNGKYDDNIERILINKDEEVNRMIIGFLKRVRNSQWAILCSYQETLYRQLDELRSGSAEKDKDTISNTQILSKEIEELQFTFLTNDNSDTLREALYDAIEIENLALKPEDIARLALMKENPHLFNPYIDDKRPIKDFIAQHFAELMEYEKTHK
jgi:hypothetical protein